MKESLKKQGIMGAESFEELGKEFQKAMEIFFAENNLQIKTVTKLTDELLYITNEHNDDVKPGTIGTYFSRAKKGHEKGKFPIDLLDQIRKHDNFGENSLLFEICNSYNKKYNELETSKARLNEDYRNESLKNFISLHYNNKPTPLEFLALQSYKDMVQDDFLIFPTATIFISLLFFPNLMDKISPVLQTHLNILIKKARIQHNEYLSYLPTTHIEHLISENDLMKIRDVAIAKIGKDKLEEIYDILKTDQELINSFKILITELKIQWSSFPSELKREAIYSSKTSKHVNDYNYICKVSCLNYFPFDIYVD